LIFFPSTGRCGTLAICEAFNRFSPASVAHEPPPRLLREAWLCHLGLAYRTPLLEERLAFYRQQGPAYGETFRAVPLLDEFATQLPDARFVLLFRDPFGYLKSAASRGVLARGDEWDLYRVLPTEVDLSRLNRAERILLHWDSINRHLLRFAARWPERTLAVDVQNLATDLPRIAEFANWQVSDRVGVEQLLATKPNAGGTGGFPPEEDTPVGDDIRDRVQRTWSALGKL